MTTTLLAAEVRRPAVAGSFYPADPARLAADMRRYMGRPSQGVEAPRALIAPHAGYVFSGATAGKTFAALQGAQISRVVLLGPSHRASFRGAALPDRRLTAFGTPLGNVPLDEAAMAVLRATPLFDGPPYAHDGEHCLEVELPFLQVALPGVPIVPILVGHLSKREDAVALARGLAAIVDGSTLVVVSSDFTHHGQPYGHAPFPTDRQLPVTLIDLARRTAQRAAAIDPRGFWHQVEVSSDTVCGVRPITVLLELLAHAFAGSGQVVDITTSAEVSGNVHQVVTYVGVTFSGRWRPWREAAPPPVLGTLDEAEQRAALALARATLESYLHKGPQLASWFAQHPVTGNLAAVAGVFVTIHNTGARAARDGRLRGCIGAIEAREPLVDAIVRAAQSAANDPRFAPLAGDELPQVSLEVSVLSPLTPVPGPEAIELGRHGVILAKGGRRAVFLPQVATETGWDRDTFLTQLARKAGLPGDAWRSGATFEVFTAQVFGEQE
jgi:hypothetical protein